MISQKFSRIEHLEILLKKNNNLNWEEFEAHLVRFIESGRKAKTKKARHGTNSKTFLVSVRFNSFLFIRC